jgi:hypothetical protein
MLITRLFIIVVGLGITLFGIKYSLDVFLALYNYLQKPETLTLLIEKWITLLNIKEFIISDYPMGKLLAVVILAIGTLLLLRVTLGFIQAGTAMLINSAAVGTVGNSYNGNEKAVTNLESKLNKLKSMADQGLISKQAYEEARDKYLVQKVINDSMY